MSINLEVISLISHYRKCFKGASGAFIISELHSCKPLKQRYIRDTVSKKQKQKKFHRQEAQVIYEIKHFFDCCTVIQL